jgi:hypothetical protein
MEGAELRAFWMDPMEQGGSHVLRVRVVGRGDPASVAAAYGRARAAVRGRPVSGGPTWPGPCLTLAPDGVTVLGITGWGDGGEGAGLCVFAAVPVLGEAGAQEAWASMSPLLGPAAARAALSAFF